MDMLDFCRKVYRDFVDAQPIPTELKRALRSHERVPRFIDNLAIQFRKANSKVSKEDLTRAVQDMTRFFILAVDRACIERVMSPLQKAILKQKEADKEQFRQEAEALENQGVTRVTEDQKGETDIQKIRFD